MKTKMKTKMKTIKKMMLISLMILPFISTNSYNTYEYLSNDKLSNTISVDTIQNNIDIYIKTLLIYDVFNITYKNNSDNVEYNMTAIDASDNLSDIKVIIYNDGSLISSIDNK